MLRIRNLRARTGSAFRTGEDGFTLPELLVVIVIIGILASIAVPTFIGARNRGHDSRAKSNLRSALAAERTYYVDYQTYTTDATALRAIESNLDWSTTDADVEGVMGAISGTQVVVLVSTSQSGKQFCIMNIAADVGTAVNGQTAAGTYYATNPAEVTTPPTSVTTGQCGTTGYVRSLDGWDG